MNKIHVSHYGGIRSLSVSPNISWRHSASESSPTVQTKRPGTATFCNVPWRSRRTRRSLYSPVLVRWLHTAPSQRWRSGRTKILQVSNNNLSQRHTFLLLLLLLKSEEDWKSRWNMKAEIKEALFLAADEACKLYSDLIQPWRKNRKIVLEPYERGPKFLCWRYPAGTSPLCKRHSVFMDLSLTLFYIGFTLKFGWRYRGFFIDFSLIFHWLFHGLSINFFFWFFIADCCDVHESKLEQKPWRMTDFGSFK